MNDDFNTPILISHLFEGVRIINSVKDGKETLTAEDLGLLRETMNAFVFNILGLKHETGNEHEALIQGLMQTILDIRQQARANKDWPTSDLIRDNLLRLNIQVKDTKDGSEWSLE
jgi:cysteinyl-tRNA synthetase